MSLSLEEEVAQNRKNIRSDALTMSIGEAVNMYRDREITIRPEYQRLFRWDIEKQSRLIESILLSIPLPPIFVAQLEDGTWEVVDGLQRLSTILRFMNELRDEEGGGVVDSQPLVRMRYLPSLEGATWETGEGSFSNALRIGLKRARLDFQILLRESDEQVKFEVFDRLNSGGAPTSAQEVRTAQLLMRAREFYLWVDGLRRNEAYLESVPLSTRQFSEQYDLELVIRFLVLANSTLQELRNFTDIDSFLTDRALDLSEDGKFDKSSADDQFVRVFNILRAAGSDAFRKFDAGRQKYVGAFSVSAYEATALGVLSSLAKWEAMPREELPVLLQRAASNLWRDAQFLRYSGAGVRATQRVPVMGAVGARVLNPENIQ